ncbi:MAG TPA: gliding motility-associated C-terminal domain-containing protein, partial [Sphingobacteriaceae bacterium]
TVKFQADGSFTYTPKKGFTGKDSFTYQVCTPEGLCSSARVEITVIPYTIVNLTPGLSTIPEGGQVSVTATLEKAFNEDVVIRLSYKGKAARDTDYVLSEQFQTIRIPKGQLTTPDRIRIFASVDNLEEDAEDVIIEIAGTSHENVRIGSGAIVIIHNSQSSGPVNQDPGSTSPDSKFPEPQPLVSPNGDNNNDFFQIRNIDNFPNNEVVIFNRWGNEVFRTKGYNHGNGNVFRGLANRGLQLGNNDNLPDGVYYYLITPDTSKVQATDLLKGYLILKRN